jgi:hypothetical protein
MEKTAQKRCELKGAEMGSENKSTMKRRLVSGASMAGVAFVAMMGLSAGSAQAETTDVEVKAGTCASGYVCGWEDDGYGGDKWMSWNPSGVGANYEIDGWDGDNEITSIINNSGHGIKFYDQDGQAGNTLCVGNGVRINNLQDYAWNDRAESAKAVSRC